VDHIGFGVSFELKMMVRTEQVMAGFESCMLPVLLPHYVKSRNQLYEILGHRESGQKDYGKYPTRIAGRFAVGTAVTIEHSYRAIAVMRRND
jgi:hypothetical protein